MDRLINIKSQDSYPWVVEEIAILEKHGDYINALLDGLRLPGGSCVFVQKHTNQNGYLQESVVYIVEPLHEDGELFFLKGDDTVKVADLLSGEAEKMHIYKDTDDVVVEGSQNQTWDECYTLKTVELSASAGDEYTFYDLNDLLRPAVWEGTAEDNLNEVVEESAQQVGVNIALDAAYPQVMRRNNSELEICLKYLKTGALSYQYGYKHRFVNFDPGIPNGSSRPLMGITDQGNVKLCSVGSGAIFFDMDNSDSNITIWGRVSLK